MTQRCDATHTRHVKFPAPLRQRGWIGVDVGAVLTKMAQVDCRDGAMTIAARWTVPTEFVLPAAQSSSAQLSGEISGRTLQQARGMFRGRRAAAALSMSHTRYRCVDMPRGSRDELRRMISEELMTEHPSADAGELCFDFWPMGDRMQESGAMAPLAVVDLDRPLAAQFDQRIHAAGFDCRIIDALPCALARAAALFDPCRSHEPTAMLDMGATSALFVLAVDGCARFTRVLRDVALADFARLMHENMQLSPAESYQLLARIGLPSPADGSPATAGSQSLEHLTAEPLARLIAELKRTFTYLEQNSRPLAPQRIVLCGGGSVIRNLPHCIAAEMGLETVSWTMSGEDGHAPHNDDALFAVAAALSALAWETEPCM